MSRFFKGDSSSSEESSSEEESSGSGSESEEEKPKAKVATVRSLDGISGRLNGPSGWHSRRLVERHAVWWGDGVQNRFFSRSPYACFPASLRRKHHPITMPAAHAALDRCWAGRRDALGAAGDGSFSWWHGDWEIGGLIPRQWGGHPPREMPGRDHQGTWQSAHTPSAPQPTARRAGHADGSALTPPP